MPEDYTPNLERVRTAILKVLEACLETANRDQLVALGELHRVDSEELLRAGVKLVRP